MTNGKHPTPKAAARKKPAAKPKQPAAKKNPAARALTKGLR